MDLDALKPGVHLRHRSRGEPHVVTLDRRKADNSGWWNTDRSGLADSVLQGDYWEVIEIETQPEIVTDPIADLQRRLTEVERRLTQLESASPQPPSTP